MPRDAHWLELRIPPVAVVALAAMLMWIFDWQFSSFDYAYSGQILVGILIAAVGFGIAIGGVWQFRRARTTTNPMKPDASTALVDTGLYRYTRNPMYLGFALVLLGLAAGLANLLALLVLPAYVLYLTRFQIEPEERSLRNAFGPEYTDYQREVRRWI